VEKFEAESSKGTGGTTSWALLDSGATNPFRPANKGEEMEAMPIQVQLADGQAVLLRQNRAGTLMPYSKKQAAEKGTNTVIVPLGSLVQELGCTVAWTRRGLEVKHPTYGVITTHVSGACPFIGEAKALELIGEIENRKLEQLKVAMVETQLRLHGVEAQLNYGAQLSEYRRTGSRTEGLKALMCEDSVFGCLTEAQRCALAQDIDLSDKAGHKYLKALPVKRAMRKKLMTTQWLVHVYSGEGGSKELKVFEDDCVTLLEVDLGISKAFNMREPSGVYKALLWAAMRGQLYGLIGGPPRGEACGELVLKQMFLWNIARLTAEEHEVTCPIFAMTMPRKSELWRSQMWKRFQGSMGVVLNAGRPDVFLASNLVMKDSGYDAWEQTAESGAFVWTRMDTSRFTNAAKRAWRPELLVINIGEWKLRRVM
ncbi:TY1B-DR3, partial [Symbiodinium necroappetens]